MKMERRNERNGRRVNCRVKRKQNRNDNNRNDKRKFLINTVTCKQDIYDFYLHTVHNNSFNHTQYIYSVRK